MAENKQIQRRSTRQRKVILCCISGGKCCSLEEHDHSNDNSKPLDNFTADEVEALLIEQGEKVGKATIYRFINQLLKEKIIRRYITGSGSACYQYISEGAELRDVNMICQYCGKVIHVDAKEVLKKTAVMGETTNFKIDCSKTVFYGSCSECQKKNNPEEFHAS